MLRVFLTAKHWQLFAVILVAWVSSGYLKWTVVQGGEIERWWEQLQPVLYEICFLVWMILFLGWMLAVGLESNKRCVPELRRSSGIWLACLVYVACYFVFLAFLRLIVPGNADFAYQEVKLPLDYAVVACIFYSMFYTARSFVTVQKNKEVRFPNYIDPFFQIWFFPLGIWFLQPKVNKTLGSSNA